jgi:hypothetical protein
LQPYGFDQAQLEKGWMLLRHASELRGTYQPHVPKDPTIAKACDEWRMRWFAVTQAVLGHTYPEVEAWLFSGIQATYGEASTVTVPLFVKRVRTMMAEVEPVAGAHAARALLAQRGLTDAVLAAIDPWEKELARFAGEPPPAIADTQEAEAQAALWDWYLEWSGIARAAIESRSLLRDLGFGRSRRGTPTSQPGDVEPEPTPDSKPAQPSEADAQNENDTKAA